MSETVVVEIQGEVGTVTLNRPRVLNALNHETRMALISRLRELDDHPGVRVVVLQGAGRAFCAGQDQKESAQFDQEGAAKRIEMYTELFETMRRMTKAVVAKIHGYAAGAGFQLALLADLRVAAETARLGMTELNIGSPCITGSAILWPIAGEAVVKRLVLTGEFIPASEALSLGLVHEVVDEAELDRRVEDLVGTLAGKSPLATRLTKEWWRLLTDDAFQKAAEHAHRAHAENFAAGELSRGARKFIERQQPS